MCLYFLYQVNLLGGKKGVSCINTLTFFSKSFQNMLPFVFQKPSLCFCCPETVEPEEGECQVRILKCRFLQCQRALKRLHKRSWGSRKRKEVFQQHCAQKPLPLFRAKGRRCQTSWPRDRSSFSSASPASFLQLFCLPLRFLPCITLCHGYPYQLVQVGWR